MTVRYAFVTELPDPTEFELMMVEYFTGIAALFAKAGVTIPSPKDMAAETVDRIDTFLPPKGRLLIASSDGRMLGCGTLRRIRPDAGELKRMFVRPEARGRGVGRALLERRIAEAEAMGMTMLYADTVKGNHAMLAMYERARFRHIPRYPENANPEDYAPVLEFLERSVRPDGG